MGLKYDIFISYRRQGGAQYARILQLMLQQRGYKVFLDYDELTDGKFSDKIKEAVQNSDIFMLVLSKESMQRCTNKDDWVRQEITLAKKTKKQIVPVNPDNSFDGLPDDFPSEIREYVVNHQYSDINFGQTLGVTVDFMISKRMVPYIGERKQTNHVDNDYDTAAETLKRIDQRNKVIKRIVFAGTIAIVLIVLGTVFALWRHHLQKERWTTQKSDIEVMYQQFGVRLNSNITFEQMEIVDTILGNMVPVIPDSIWMNQYECRVGEWYGILGGEYDGSQRLMPMTNVSFGECAMHFLDSLRKLTGLDMDASYYFDIPNLEEWQYAAKGGYEPDSTLYAGSNVPDEVAWYRKNSGNKAHPSDGQQDVTCNIRDLFDMSGNVAEWVNQSFPTNQDGGLRTVCGGHYASDAKDITVSSFSGVDANTKSDKIGFRIIIRKK